MRGERTDLNGPFLAAQALSLGLEPARITIVGDRPDELEAALARGARAPTSASSPAGSGRRTTTGRSSSSRRLRAASSCSTRACTSEIGAVSRMVAERLRRPYADFEPGVRKQATLPGGCALARPGGHGARAGARDRARRGRRPARPAVGAAAAVAERARDRAGAAGARARRGRPAGACCASTARASRRSRRRSRTRAATGTGSRRRSAPATSRSTSTCSSSRAPRRGRTTLERALVEPLERYLFARDERPVEELVLDLCRARGLDARDGRVVHGRARRGAADVGPGLERRLPGRRSSRTRTR